MHVGLVGPLFMPAASPRNAIPEHRERVRTSTISGQQEVARRISAPGLFFLPISR
jgi:hypothetical protein